MTTPMRQQYLRIKKQFPGTIVFFRLGDFYETFDDDAKLVAQVCDIVLTSRPVGKNERVPLAGVPYHSVEGYIARLLQAGHKVAIVEQVGDVSLAGRELVEREVVRVVTPGTVVEPALLDEHRNNYLAALVLEAGRAGLAYADITTGEFAATQLDGGDLLRLVAAELDRLHPAEVVVADRKVANGWDQAPGSPLAGIAVTDYDAWRFDLDTARRALLEHLEVGSLDGFGLAGLPLATRAAGALVQYLAGTQQDRLAQLSSLRTYSTDQFMLLDPATRRNLELTQTLRGGTVKGSLLGVLDVTTTGMGSRLLRQWLNQPLLDPERVNERLDAVEALHRDTPLRTRLRQYLKGVGDLERLTGRVVQGTGRPRDLVGIRQSLEALPEIWEAIGQIGEPRPRFFEELGSLDLGGDVAALISQAVADEPPATLTAGGVIRTGFSAELDNLVAASRDARVWIADLERREQARSGIKGLKVGYNKVFGYYLEVSKANAERVPPDYIRKQTLVNAERYITPELKEYEALVLNAQERIGELEERIFRQVIEQVAAAGGRLRAIAQALARLDAYAALAEVALMHRYVRPQLTDGDELRIIAGRHPVVEVGQRDEPFVPNDTVFSDDEKLLIITGPNMSGKCVSAESLVFTNAGLVPVGSLRPGPVPEGSFAPIDYQVKGLRGLSRATHFYEGGTCPTVQIRTRLGYQLEGTPEHRVWVRHPSGEEGWKPLSQIAAGDYVAIDRAIDLWGDRVDIETPRAAGLQRYKSLKLYRLPRHMSPDLAYVVGLLVGDGTLREKVSLAITTADPYIAEEFARIILGQFGYRVRCRVKYRQSVSSLQIRLFFEELGLGYVRSTEKQVPASILATPRPVVTAFLQGLFDTDGYADVKGNVSLSTSSATLARQVHTLLLNFGIVSSLQTKKGVHSENPNYQISIYGAEALGFYRTIGFRLPRKQQGRNRVSALRMPNVGGIPYLTEMLKSVQTRIVATANKPVALKKDKSINSIFYTYLPSGRNISYFKLDELLAYCRRNGVPAAELEDLAKTRYFYDPVADITPHRAQVYDLSVADSHSFVVEGLISHNSTFLRQVALVVLMAQIGSFVPADEAQIGMVDRIFTRIGAQDEISAGQSTFMVEMVETANLLNHATPRSLLVLDEIGRGTSTYDGISIAWAVVEHIHNHPRLRCKTLFATHYHELTQLSGLLPRVRNYNVAVAEEKGKVVFLRRIVPGGADRSYGIHVAQLAGLPKPVIHRAEEILEELEQEARAPGSTPKTVEVRQLPLFSVSDPVLDELRRLDVSAMTPLEAIAKLYELQKKAGRKA